MPSAQNPQKTSIMMTNTISITIAAPAPATVLVTVSRSRVPLVSSCARGGPCVRAASNCAIHCTYADDLVVAALNAILNFPLSLELPRNFLLQKVRRPQRQP